MSLCVVAFPTISEADSYWMQSIRTKYDPQHEEIAPHVTLLFPSTSFEVAELAKYVDDVACDSEVFNIVFRCALPYRDPFSQRFHLFFVPDEGLSSVVRLHHHLCNRVFPNRNRVDVPFIPHVTVGVFDDGIACKRFADQLNMQRFEISGQVCALSIVAGSGDAIVHHEIYLRDRSH